VANQDWPVEMERVKNGKHVVAQAIGVIARRCGSGCTVPAPSDSEDMVSAGQLWSEIIVNVRGVPQAGKEYQRAT
jgi:hypothetical protein